MEIEFRGKVKYNGNHYACGEWVYGYVYKDKNGKTYIYDTEDISMYLGNGHYGHPGARYEWVEIDPKTLGQYTELKDENKQKIYDGDLLADCDDLYVVSYSVVSAEWQLILDNVTISLGQCDTEWYEVMGNIHDVAVEV
jgi:hypothetical protein